MFHSPQQQTNCTLDPHIQFERYMLKMAIEKARAEGFEGTEAALIELLRALEESIEFPEF